jgi:hypothetical protein
MKEFAADPETRVHPQTVIEHFGTWNKAKRQAGLVPRRFATREELLALLQELGKRVGRVPTAKDVDANRGWMPSKSLYWHTFDSLTNALKEAGFDVPVVPQVRGVVAPPGIPKENVAFWEDFFRRLTRTPSWQKYIADNQFEDGYQNAAQLADFYDQFTVQMREIFKDAGVKTVR